MKQEYYSPKFEVVKIIFTEDALGDSKFEQDHSVIVTPTPPGDENDW